MIKMFSFSLRIKNLKCIGEEEQGFDEIKPLNLIIGRNNSGKSTLLDIIWAATQKKIEFKDSQCNAGKRPELILEAPLTENEVRNIFNENTSRGGVPGRHHWEYGQKYVGASFKWSNANTKRFLSIAEPPSSPQTISSLSGGAEYLKRLCDGKQNPFETKTYKRIYSERNIIPEKDNVKLDVDGNGQGATNIIQNFINKTYLQSAAVEKTLLEELNKIFSPDAIFTDIVCQQDTNSLWEVYLEEKDKGRIPLSQSGSSLKTIILVLIFLHLIPTTEKKPLKEYIFAFEELENNLHPSLLRRLLAYLSNQYQSSGCIFFLTTHSSIAIDQFSRNGYAQIIHVTHDGKLAKARTVKTYVENKGVLDDLDVRASDLLQSNSVVWVEGPSDRIYFNKWIDIWSDGKLKEGIHYQCVFYGGRLLSHLSASDPKDVSGAVSIFSVNRNSVILIDSDKRSEESPLNATKLRIIEEMKKNCSIAWVTRGREIENYIPANAVARLLEIETAAQVGQYENVFEYLDRMKRDTGTYFTSKKPEFAEQITQFFEKNDLQNILDLSDRLNKICETINLWNSI